MVLNSKKIICKGFSQEIILIDSDNEKTFISIAIFHYLTTTTTQPQYHSIHTFITVAHLSHAGTNNHVYK